MNAGLFAPALVAALSSKLLAIDLLLIENRRPRAVFLCLLTQPNSPGSVVKKVLLVRGDSLQGNRRRPPPGITTMAPNTSSTT